MIIYANQAVGNYWFRAEVQSPCGTNAMNGNIKSIFSYTGATSGNPNTTGTAYTQSCTDETQLVPYVQKNVPSNQFIPQAEALDVVFTRALASNGQNVVQWMVNGSIIDVDWEKPTLQYVIDGNTSYPTDLNLIDISQANVVSSSWSVKGVFNSPSAVAILDHPRSPRHCCSCTSSHPSSRS